MPSGIDLTFQVLDKTKNQSVVKLLESAFVSSKDEIRRLAALSLINRQGSLGVEAFIRDFDPGDSFCVSLVNSNRQKIVAGLRTAIVSSDSLLSQNAVRMMTSQKLYEVLPTLYAYCFGSAGHENTGKLMQKTLLRFTDTYIEALERREPHERHLLFNVVFPELTRILGNSVKTYRNDTNELTLNVLLRLYPFFTDVERDLKQVLCLPNHPLYIAAYRQLLTENDPHLFQFITRNLNRTNVSPIVSLVLSKRCDVPFLSAVFAAVKNLLPLETQAVLNSLTEIEWLNQVGRIIDRFDGEALAGYVDFLQRVPISDEARQAQLLAIFYHGQGAGRVAAFMALKQYENEKMSRLVWDAVEDKDPDVQIEAMNEMYRREMQGMASRIIQLSSSPDNRVRNTVRKLMPNFRFDYFIDRFDQLNESQRQRFFEVVCRLDDQTAEKIKEMLETGDQKAQGKALMCIGYCPDLVIELEVSLAFLLENSTSAESRQLAAEFLVGGRQEKSRGALVQAFHRDSSPAVREAAKKSLESRPIR